MGVLSDTVDLSSRQIVATVLGKRGKTDVINSGKQGRMDRQTDRLSQGAMN